MKTSDLRMREVINIVDGRRLGTIKDIDLNLEEGRVEAIVIPGFGSGSFLGFLGKDDELIVPWEKIRKIGMDVILVEV